MLIAGKLVRLEQAFQADSKSATLEESINENAVKLLQLNHVVVKFVAALVSNVGNVPLRELQL